MYERRSERLLTRAEFTRRVFRHLLFGLGAVVVALGLGVVGYRYLAHLNWEDALLNASMILGGMGPIDPIQGTAAKIFASGYALFSGLFFIALLGFLLGPFAHRLMHRFHWEPGSEDSSSHK
jgi:sterol desaturase/sphingolipid hydroxylase (fatty acid hydroxylase superfamily)